MYKKVKTIHEAVTCAVERAETLEWALLSSEVDEGSAAWRIQRRAHEMVNDWSAHLADRRLSNVVHLREI